VDKQWNPTLKNWKNMLITFQPKSNNKRRKRKNSKKKTKIYL